MLSFDILSNYLIRNHYNDVRMIVVASQITSVFIVCSNVGSDADRRKHQSFASLAFVRGISRWPVNSPHKWPVTLKMFPFDDVIMIPCRCHPIPSRVSKSSKCNWVVVLLYGTTWNQHILVKEKTKQKQMHVYLLQTFMNWITSSERCCIYVCQEHVKIT